LNEQKEISSACGFQELPTLITATGDEVEFTAAMKVSSTFWARKTT